MYFSVKLPVKIAGKTFIPCVCYKVTDVIKRNVERLEQQGKATVYEDKVFFQNGKVLKSESAVREEIRVQKSTEKKAKKRVAKEVMEEAVTEAEDMGF